MIYCTHDRFQRPLGMTLPCLWAWHVEFHSSIHRKELVKGSAWARPTPRGASPAEVKGTSIEDIAQVVGKSGRRRDGALRFGGVNRVLTLLNHMKKG